LEWDEWEMNDTKLWKTKLSARIHDPAEKALVLLRDPAGHEGGTVKSLCQNLFGTHQIPKECEAAVKQADHWASAADRPQFPQDANKRYPAWAQVNFAEQPELIHPLTGEVYLDRQKLDITPAQVKAVSFDHFDQLIQRKPDKTPDYEKTLLAFWRFGPDKPAQDLNVLWQLLPADTRIPDHTIWQHLDLSSAFAGAVAEDEKPALLVVSIGPVQEFIAAARTTSDLWVGSHLLSTLAWQAMKVVCERLGPDSLLFPQLRGVPIVDVWLAQEKGLDSLFDEQTEWKTKQTDNNPLFAAALPNKFMALVPASQTEALAEEITSAVRDWVKQEGEIMLNMLLDEAKQPKDETPHCFEQLEGQLQGFPEVHWAAVPWLAETELAQAMAGFYPEKDKKPGFLGSHAWEILNREIQLEDGFKFFTPNPGTLYPAVYELTERLLAAAKSVRAFGQLEQNGYRDSLSGEMEWLTTQAVELQIPPGQRKDTLWAKVAQKRPAWARKGEHLSALAMMKRLWPNRFRQWIKEEAGLDLDVQRYVVSTHTMALASSLEKLLDGTIENSKALQTLYEQAKDLEAVALPRCLMRKVHECPDPVRAGLARRVPALLEKLRESEEGELNPQAKEQALRIREETEKLVKDALGSKPERYYALILMDGDNMGAWLSGNEEQYQLPFQAAWHSKVRNGIDPFAQKNAPLKGYLHGKRPASPARHMAISSALNGFALDLARHIVEDLCKGKLIYAGGDDVLAMVSIDDLSRCLWLLRLAYSGTMPEGKEPFFGDLDMDMNKGFVLWQKSRQDRRFYRVMGEKATASAGAVVAHHTAPLGAVLRELRNAEKAAKAVDGKNAFSLRMLKRAGGKVELTLPWSLRPAGEFEALAESPMGALVNLQRTLAGDLSRRTAYLSDVWLERLPVESKDLEKLLSTNLAYQFKRQGGDSKDKEKQAENLARAEHLAHVAVTVGQDGTKTIETLRNMLAVAEFLAREGRAGAQDETSPLKETANA
jgi:CRISPR-associated protein Cmr2